MTPPVIRCSPTLRLLPQLCVARNVSQSRCGLAVFGASAASKRRLYATASFRRGWTRQGAGATLTLVASCLALSYKLFTDVHAEELGPPPKVRLREVREHDRNAERIWITKGTRVYDITDWVPNHPGGEVILRAAGGSVDEYWNIFSIHQKQDVHDILEQYFVGEIDERDLEDGRMPQTFVDDPFKSDPTRDDDLHIHSERPCNAETPEAHLTNYITPNNVFYVRNHLWVPNIDNVDDYSVTIELADGEERKYSLREIQDKFQEHTITATLQCSGNRRHHMTEGAGRSTQGLQWGVGAIGNAEWTGVRLRDVLADAGLRIDDPPEEVQHVQFAGSEAYGASIPLEKAINRRGDVLLAYKMNGMALPRDHGFPLRVIVPGHVAARSVKWVNRITLAAEESQSHWQQRDYKCFGPYEDGSAVDWSAAPAIQELPVQSAFTKCQRQLQEGSKEPEQQRQRLQLQGYALSGGGRRIVRVDVSIDGGGSWQEAELMNDPALGSQAWGWQRWKIAVPRQEVGQWLTVKAIDEAYQSQPETQASNWNFRGNLSTAWQRVKVE